MSRLKRAALLSAAVSALVAVPTANAADVQLSGEFTGKQARMDQPCPEPFSLVCGTGTVAGFGPATYSFVPLAGSPFEGSCRALSGAINIELSDGSGALGLFTSGTICYPGNSHFTPSQQVGFGNPFRFDGTWEVLGSSGIFAGASGIGTATIKGAGARSRLHVSGVLTL